MDNFKENISPTKRGFADLEKNHLAGGGGKTTKIACIYSKVINFFLNKLADTKIPEILLTAAPFPQVFHSATLFFDGKIYSNRSRRKWIQYPTICEAQFRCLNYRSEPGCKATMKLTMNFSNKLPEGKKTCILGKIAHTCGDQRLIEKVEREVPFIRDIKEEMRKTVEELAISMPCERAGIIADKINNRDSCC